MTGAAEGANRLSNKHHSESSKSHNARKKHDQEVRQHAQTTGNPWHESKGARIGMAAIAIIAVVSLTLLFVGGVIKW